MMEEGLINEVFNFISIEVVQSEMVENVSVCDVDTWKLYYNQLNDI